MSTPYVSGVAALVQSAFPYMGGKQIADVLLSTATKFDYNNTPAVFVLYREEKETANADPEKADPEPRLQLYYDVDRYTSGINVIDDIMGGDKTGLINAIQWYLKNLTNLDDEPVEVLESIINSGQAIDKDTYLSLFGAGIVNAGKAVRGPGYLDANRLENEDKETYDGVEYAMYPVDTKGFDSTWSNDIGQVQVSGNTDQFTDELDGLDVGLLKQGDGLLYLTGAGEYEGMTAVQGGGISLGKTGQADGAAKLAGSVYIGPDGMFTGNGDVADSMESHGLLIPGLDSGPGNLTVHGDVASDGRMLVHVWPEAGRANKLIVGGGVDLSGTSVSIADMAGGHMLPSGSYEIVKSSTLSGIPPVMGDRVALQGVTLLHTFDLSSTGNILSADYRGTETNPQAKALSEGFIGGTVILNQGADLAAGAGIENAAGAAKSAAGRAGPGTGHGIAAFGAVSAGWSRYNTGSHVNMKGFSLLTGFSSGRELPPGFLTLGAFVEFGAGFYDTYNSFGNAAAVHGDGETEYFGGGVLGRMDFSRTGPGRFHAEASARLGLTMTDYDGTGLRDYRGRAASYSSESAYYGLHAGLGYAWELTNEATLDLYGKYFWTRQSGDRVTLSTGDPVKFEDTDSHRVRAGARFSYKVNDSLAPYIGAAYEHEFDGRVRASTNGFSLPVPSLDGDTGVWEFGIAATPAESLPTLTVNAGVQGYTGKREGLTGSLQFKLEF
jgi:autotransporter-associated beta strand protein